MSYTGLTRLNPKSEEVKFLHDELTEDLTYISLLVK